MSVDFKNYIAWTIILIGYKEKERFATILIYILKIIHGNLFRFS